MTRSHAKALRANMTEAERRLWYFLRAHRFSGMKFKRPALIGRYIVDFVSFQRRLVVEVDGDQHAESEDDLRRTRWLESQGFRILRFWNNEVLSNTGGVLDAIMTASPNPSPGTPLRGAPPSPTRGEGTNDRDINVHR
jgi:very-short-patch-repair endonuclease